MIDNLDINSSPDLLDDFLNQGQEPKIEVTDNPDEGKKITKPDSTDSGLDIITDLPDDFTGDDIEPDGEPDLNTSDLDGDYSFKALAGFLSEEGILDFEDSDDLEDKPEVLINSVKSTIEKEIQAYKDSIPDKAKQIIEFLEKGGDLDSYLTSVQKPFDIKSIDLENERDQEKVVREMLKLQGYEPDEIDDSIQDYKDSLILDKQSKLAEKQVKKYYDRKEQELIEHQEAESQRREEDYRSYISTINNSIDTSNSIAGLEVDNKDKTAFKQYLLARDKDGITAYERELSEDPVKVQLELAYLKFKKYDFTKAIKEGETKATKNLKNIFKRSETNNTVGKSIDEVKGGDFDAFASFRSSRR